MKLLVIYDELATYFLTCITALAKKHNCQVIILRKEINKEAPFDFEGYKDLRLINKSEFIQSQSLQEEVKKFSPEVIYCCGWSSLNLQILDKLREENDLPAVIGFDNSFRNTLRQRVGSIYFRWWLKKKFDAAFVPGPRQKDFAKRLGFSDDKIALGAYCADQSFFEEVYNKNRSFKQQSFPKRFIYCARYVKWKGIFELWNAFVQLQEEQPSEWELWCLGTGEEFENRIEHPKIRHFGFVQPVDLQDYLANTSVYILPSHFEPWGVSVHEFASAGFPMLLSREVGATYNFLEVGKNGFFFDPGNVDQIKEAMKKIMVMSNEELNNMSEKSVELSRKITPSKWADIIHALFQKVQLPYVDETKNSYSI